MNTTYCLMKHPDHYPMSIVDKDSDVYDHLIAAGYSVLFTGPLFQAEKRKKLLLSTVAC